MVREPDLIANEDAIHISAHCNYLRLTHNGNGLPFKIETFALCIPYVCSLPFLTLLKIRTLMKSVIGIRKDRYILINIFLILMNGKGRRKIYDDSQNELFTNNKQTILVINPLVFELFDLSPTLVLPNSL